MALTIIISSITAVLLTASVIVKPYVKIGKIKIGLYWVISLIGAILILLTGRLPVKTALDGLLENTAVNPLKILALFLSMTVISLFLGEAGFFGYVADKIFKKTKGGGLKLFLALYFTVAILTVFTSNDIIILTFTPPICIFCKKAKVSPIPYLFGEFVAANTWSMALIVGNPTNIYLAGSLSIGFFEYFKVMVLPTVLGGITGLLILLLLFKKSLTEKSENVLYSNETEVPFNKLKVIVALTVLIITIILLAVAEFIKAEMWFICVCAFIFLVLFNLIYGITKKDFKDVKNVFVKAPYELIPFVISMFIIVLGLKESGVTEALNKALLLNDKLDGVSFGFLSAVSSNLLNNIPMSVLFEKIVAGTNKYALYGSVIGSNVGAFITPVGALAGIMWGKILTSYDVKFSFRKFVCLGLTVAVPVLAVSTFSLFLVL